MINLRNYGVVLICYEPIWVLTSGAEVLLPVVFASEGIVSPSSGRIRETAAPRVTVRCPVLAILARLILALAGF